MKKLLLFVLLLFYTVELNPNFYIFLAFGQSNMDGVGPRLKEDINYDRRFKMMAAVNMPKFNRRKGQWYTASPPLSRQGSIGINPCDYFGRTLIKNLPKKVKVGVIVVSLPGQGIKAFMEEHIEQYIKGLGKHTGVKRIFREYGNNPFRRLVDLGKRAQRFGVIKGILMQQGEANSRFKQWPFYVKTIYERLLKELNLKQEEVPFLVGQLVSYKFGSRFRDINERIKNLPKLIKNCHYISSEGLIPLRDKKHYTIESMRELGRRFGKTMCKLLPNCKNEADKKNETFISALDSSPKKTQNPTNNKARKSSFKKSNNPNSKIPVTKKTAKPAPKNVVKIKKDL